RCAMALPACAMRPPRSVHVTPPVTTSQGALFQPDGYVRHDCRIWWTVRSHLHASSAAHFFHPAYAAGAPVAAKHLPIVLRERTAVIVDLDHRDIASRDVLRQNGRTGYAVDENTFHACQRESFLEKL